MNVSKADQPTNHNKLLLALWTETMSSEFTLESFTVESSYDGVKLHTRLFKPGPGVIDDVKDKNFAIVLVHPYSVLGGSQGLLKGIASSLALHGYTAVTFDMRGVGKSTGRPSLTGFSEIKDVVAVSNWVSHSLSLHKILLIGSSAGRLLSFIHLTSGSDQICN